MATEILLLSDSSQNPSYCLLLRQGNIFRSVCQEFCPQGGHAWQGGIRGRGPCMAGACVAGRACMVGGCMAERCAWQRGVHGRGCMAGGHTWQGGACMAVGHAWQGGHAWPGGMRGRRVCMAGGGVHGRGAYLVGVCMAGGHVWQEKRQLQRAVRILLECILVLKIIMKVFILSQKSFCLTPHNIYFEYWSILDWYKFTLRAAYTE